MRTGYEGPKEETPPAHITYTFVPYKSQFSDHGYITIYKDDETIGHITLPTLEEAQRLCTHLKTITIVREPPND